VTADVRITVEYDETACSSVDYLISFVIVDVGVKMTKNTAAGLGFSGAA
jgi:hypothetical protein